MSKETQKSRQPSEPPVREPKPISERVEEVDAVIVRRQDGLKRARRERRRLERLQTLESRRKERKKVEDYVKSLPTDAKFTLQVLLDLGVKAEASGLSITSIFEWLDGKRRPPTKNKQPESKPKTADGPAVGSSASETAADGGASS
jgi:hypothetical protein